MVFANAKWVTTLRPHPMNPWRVNMKLTAYRLSDEIREHLRQAARDEQHNQK